MSTFQLDAIDDLIGAINAANGTSFVLADLSFGTPTEVDGTWQGVSSDRNSAVKVSAADATYQGNVTILYNRLDLSQLANLPGLQLRVSNPSTVSDILPQLKYYLGIDFLAGDLEDSAISLTDGAGTVTLTAQATSLGWTGTVDLTVLAGGAPIDADITVPALPGLNYPVDDADAPPASAVYGPIYLYGYDFTPYTATFLNYTAGVVDSTQADFLVSALLATDLGTGKSIWNDTTSGATFTTWNIDGATIVSNGLNDPDSLPTNPAYKYVMVLQLRADVTIPTGVLYLHYNDPFDPDDF